MFAKLFAPPSQLVPDSIKKTKKWQIDTVDAFETLVLFENRQIKTSYFNKITNYNLKRGILNMNDIEKVVDPYGLGLGTFPAKMEHKGIGNAKIDLLVGEHIKRKFDFRVIRSSSDQQGIKEIEEKKSEEIIQFFIEQLQNPNFDEKNAERRLQDIKDHQNSSYYDIAERGANKLLKYITKIHNVKDILFDPAFEDALICAEQFAFIEELGGEIVIRKGDPTRIFTIMNGHSTTERGLEALVEITYHTVSSIVDMFHDELSKDQIKELEQYRGMTAGQGPYMVYPMYGHVGELAIPSDSMTAQMQNIMPLGDLDVPMFSSFFDARGNIRLLHCIWRSKRKVKLIKSLDENGVEILRYEHEKYKIDKFIGEVIEREEWINEWWRGYKIGASHYVKIQPIPYLANSLDNISRQDPPVIVQYYNTNTSRAQSLMDIIKPYDYLYNIFDYKRQLLINLMLPDIIQFPTSMIPDNMTLHEFLNYVTSTAFMPMDPTADVMTSKGMQAAGTFNTIVPNRLSSNQAGPISVLSQVLNNIVQTMDIVSGITQQRQGTIHNTELVGNVERSVTQSSLSTEKWFAKNEFFKERCLKRILDVSINIMRKTPQRLSYLMDDFTKVVMTDEELSNIFLTDFDLLISRSSDDAMLLQMIEQNFQQSIASGIADIGDLISVYKTESVQDAARILKKRRAEIENRKEFIQQQQVQLQQQQMQQQQQIAQSNMELELKKLELEKYRIDIDSQTRLQVATLQSYDKQQKLDANQIINPIEMEKIFQKERESDSKQLDKKLSNMTKSELDNKKLHLEEKKLNVKKEVEILKAKTSKEIEEIKLKNPVVGEKINKKS